MAKKKPQPLTRLLYYLLFSIAEFKELLWCTNMELDQSCHPKRTELSIVNCKFLWFRPIATHLHTDKFHCWSPNLKQRLILARTKAHHYTDKILFRFLQVDSIFWNKRNRLLMSNYQLRCFPFHGRLAELKLPSSVRSKATNRENTDGPNLDRWYSGRT